MLCQPGPLGLRPKDAVLDGQSAKVVAKECERLLASNPFDLIGVHWSEHPDLIKEKYERRKERFAPSSKKAQLSPELATQVRNELEKAHSVLADRAGRKKVRETLTSIDVKAAAHIMAKHAELASLRDDALTVKRCLEMAMELYPTTEHQNMIQRLLKK